MTVKETELLFRHSFEPITITDLVAYTGASGEFNPVHHDPEAAAEAGLGAVMVHGTYAAGLVGAVVAERFDAASIESFSVRFLAPLWVGEAPVLSVWEGQEEGLQLELAVGAKVVLRASVELRGRSA